MVLSKKMPLTDKPRSVMVTAVFVLVADRLLKSAALRGAAVGGDLVAFRLFLNKGLAFSLSPPPLLFWSALLLGLVALVLVFAQAWRGRPILVVPLLVVAVGALSNLWDRFTAGAVIDYIVFLRQGAINLADVLIVGGLVWIIFLERRRSLDATPPPEAPGGLKGRI